MIALPGYEPVRQLGSGASCQVWLMREAEGLRRPVAVKLFHDLAAYRRELDVVRRVEELRRESRCAALVQSLATGEVEGRGYICFEWLEGGTLEERVRARGPLPFAEALEHAREAARALALLHAGGIFHRDVKPSNLLLGSDGRVRLGDYGLSRALDGTLSAAGSPAFAAPEAIAGRALEGKRLDVYSLGATLAWLLTGETMLPGRPDVFLMERHGVPRDLQRLVVRAMAFEPEERFAGMGEMFPETTPPERDLVEVAAVEAALAADWLPIHVQMVMDLGQAHGCAMDREGALELLRRIGGGSVAEAAQRYASTIAIGAVATLFFQREGGLSEAELRGLYRRWLVEPELAPRVARLQQLDRMLAAGLISDQDHARTLRRIVNDR